jgi:hypothetical protein
MEILNKLRYLNLIILEELDLKYMKKLPHNKIKINTFSLSYNGKKFVFPILRSPVLKNVKNLLKKKYF